MKMYKVLVNGESVHGGSLKWDLPKNGKPGKWHSVKGKIVKCQNGLHLTAKPYEWFKWGADIYEAEGRGQKDGDDNKTAFRSARLFAKCDKPGWLTKTEEFVASIKDVKWYSNGKLTKSKKIKMFETLDTAWAATQPATRATAWDAMWAATRAATRAAAEDAIWDAIWDATRAAAGDAIWDAGRPAARDAALLARCLIAELKGKHTAHAKLRWSVWQSGYGVLCDVNGILYCYKKP